MWIDFDKGKAPKLRSPTLIVAVSTSIPQYKALYSQAREMGRHLLDRMEFVELATVRSSAFPPEVIVRDDGTAELPACRFYLAKGEDELVLFAGDTSPMDSQAEFAEELLSFAEGLGVKVVISVGARWTENPVQAESEPEVKGFATDESGVAALRKVGVTILGEEPAPFFASMVVAQAGEHGMRGYKLSVDHGEPLPHHRSVKKLLETISALTGAEIPTDGLQTTGKTESAKADPGIYK